MCILMLYWNTLIGTEYNLARLLFQQKGANLHFGSAILAWVIGLATTLKAYKAVKYLMFNCSLPKVGLKHYSALLTNINVKLAIKFKLFDPLGIALSRFAI